MTSPSIYENARANVSNARRQVDQAYGFLDQDVTTPYQDAITRGQKGVKAASVTTGLQDVVTKGKSVQITLPPPLPPPLSAPDRKLGFCAFSVLDFSLAVFLDR